MFPWLIGAESTPASSVGDPGATRTVYIIVVLLVLVSAGLAYFTYRFWQRTRPGLETIRAEIGGAQVGEVRRRGPQRTPSGPPPQRSPRPAGGPREAQRPRRSSEPRRPAEPRRQPPVERPVDGLEDDPWLDSRGPRPRPQKSLRDPLL